MVWALFNLDFSICSNGFVTVPNIPPKIICYIIFKQKTQVMFVYIVKLGLKLGKHY